MHNIKIMYRCRQSYIFISMRRTIIITAASPPRRFAATTALAHIAVVALQIDIFVLYLCSVESSRTRRCVIFFIRRS